MTDDLVKRLREAAALPNGLYAEAADEIERLRALVYGPPSHMIIHAGCALACSEVVHDVYTATERRAQAAEAERDELRARVEAAPVVKLEEMFVAGGRAWVEFDVDSPEDADKIEEMDGKRVRLVVDEAGEEG